MEIDRSNYEIWLIDWLDGNLNEIQIEQLQLFLCKNPDLKDEFDELATFRLHPSVKSFPGKVHMIKSISDLTTSQVEYLSVAYLENDLTPEQQAELKESIATIPEKMLSFELIQKSKLIPPVIPYKHKSRLFRRTIAQKAIRISLIGLSAAAIILLAVVTYFSKPKTTQVKFEKTALNITADSVLRRPEVKIAVGEIKSEKRIIPSKKQGKILTALSKMDITAIAETGTNKTENNDSLKRSAENLSIMLYKIPVSDVIVLNGEPIRNTLIASSSIIPVPEYDDGRSRFGKFIAKTFREKILKEKSPKDSPLKVYEIAEAGVTGLNKLLGWEMALDERKDANGELKSVYFSSKILKFNAPVKKTEPLP